VTEGEAPGEVIKRYGLCRTTIYKWLADAKSGSMQEGAHEGIGPGTPPMCLTASGRRFSGGGRPKRAGPSPGVFATLGPQPGSAPGALPGDLSVPCSLTESQRS
jgi:hypothetical protein